MGSAAQPFGVSGRDSPDLMDTLPHDVWIADPRVHTSKLLEIVDALTIRNFLKESFLSLSAFPGKTQEKPGTDGTVCDNGTGWSFLCQQAQLSTRSSALRLSSE